MKATRHCYRNGNCRVIKIIPGQLLTDEWTAEIDWAKNNGVDVERNILKIAVIKRHMPTEHKGIGFLSGIGITGAVASTVSHDSHNLVIIGANDEDMMCVANHVIEMGEDMLMSYYGKILAGLLLPITGLMSKLGAPELAERNQEILHTVASLGVSKEAVPLMTMDFVSLAVISSMKLTTKGLVDVGSLNERAVPFQYGFFELCHQ